MLNKVIFVGIFFLLSACAHKPSTLVSSAESRLLLNQFKKVKMPDPVELKLKAKLGQIEKTKFNSASKTEVFEGGSLTNTIEESIEFMSKAEITKLLSGDEFIERVTTSKKDGQIDLHDFAMPEVGEELMITYNSNGKILKAGNLSPDSLYYVPPVSLPTEKVGVGDTWTMNSHWITDQGVPLSLRLLSILKGFIECGDKDVCADIELSGEVGIDSNMVGVTFQSIWKGRIFFALGRGSLLWSIVESHEAWNSEKVHREVRSCLESTLADPIGWNPWKDETHKCQIPSLEAAAQD